jgi:hypothetical protein
MMTARQVRDEEKKIFFIRILPKDKFAAFEIDLAQRDRISFALTGPSDRRSIFATVPRTHRPVRIGVKDGGTRERWRNAEQGVSAWKTLHRASDRGSASAEPQPVEAQDRLPPYNRIGMTRALLADMCPF